MKSISEQKLFIYIALFFGMLFVFLTPPFQSPDEDSHFKKAYLTSKGQIYPIVKGEKIGNYLPIEMIDYISEKIQYIGDRYKKYSYSEFVNDQYGSLDADSKKFNVYSTSQVLFLAYIPSAIGIIISKIFAIFLGMHNVSVPYMLYFARIASLLFSVFLVSLALKITPVLKKTMLVVALMPMSLFLMSMVTYDSLIISVSLLTVAYILRLIYDSEIKQITKKDIIILTLLGFVLFNYKVVYSTLFILLFFIPKKKFKSNKSKISKIAIIALLVLIFTLIFKLPLLSLPSVTDNSKLLVNRQINFVTGHPLKFLHILLHNIFYQRATQITGMIGIFGLIDTFIPLPIILIYILLLFVISLSEDTNKKNNISVSMKISIVFAVCLSILSIFGGMYISWTPKIYGEIGTFDLTGVQGRYFIPLLYPALLIFSNNKIKGKFANIINNNFVMVILFSLVVSEIAIILRFWV